LYIILANLFINKAKINSLILHTHFFREFILVTPHSLERIEEILHNFLIKSVRLKNMRYVYN
jgi:hypothetical protein